jgi:hypothetical protein
VGEHNEEVLGDVLGWDRARIAEAAAAAPRTRRPPG